MTVMGSINLTLKMSDITKYIDVVSGSFHADKITLFSVFRDEMFFCEAFFEHYRSIGVEQFVILDDRSEDGTSEFLAQQNDCVLLSSTLRYGTPIVYSSPTGEISDTRFGIYFKMAIASLFCENAYVVYVDADEYLFLPNQVKSLSEIIDRLAKTSSTGIVASIVEFFPKNIDDLGKAIPTNDLAGMIATYDHFQNEPVLELKADGSTKFGKPTKSMQLFKHYNIFESPQPAGRFGKLKSAFGLGQKKIIRRTPRTKIPLYYSSKQHYLTGTHQTNTAPSGQLMLTIAHFVFTSQFKEKIERAIEWRSYSQNSDKYEAYEKLYTAMKKNRASFLNDKSVRFTSTKQFEKAGLAKWPESDNI